MNDTIMVTVAISKDIMGSLFDEMEHRGLNFEQALEQVLVQAICKCQNEAAAELAETEKAFESLYDTLERSERRAKCAGEELKGVQMMLERSVGQEMALTDKLENWKETAGRFKVELGVTEDLLEERNRLLELIPACPAHGDQCVPHAIAWVKTRLEECQCEYDCR